MAAQLAPLAPDILLLQECLAAPADGLDTAGHLAMRLGLRQAAWHGRRKPRRVDGEVLDSTSGVAVLSRYPIVWSRVLPLPDDPRDGERAALLAALDHPREPVLAVSLHLTHLADAGPLRRRQFQSILDALPPVMGGIAVLGGDFNAPMDAFRDMSDIGVWRWADARLLAGVTPRPTFPEDGSCIDHILAAYPERGTPPAVEAFEIVLDRPDAETGLLPSDHVGLSVRLGL